MQRSITQSSMQPLLHHPRTHPPQRVVLPSSPCDSHAQLFFSQLMNRFVCIASPFDNLPIDRDKADTAGFCPHANTPPLMCAPVSLLLYFPLPLLPCTACSCTPIFPMSCKSAFRYVEAADLAMRCGISAATE